MRHAVCCLVMLGLAAACGAAEFGFDEGPDGLNLIVDGKVWLRTMTAPFSPKDRDETYKVYTHIYDFEGTGPITKGPGGKFPHHRGLFIGWKDTIVQGTDYDTWHMSNSYQQHVAWLELNKDGDAAVQQEKVAWNAPDGTMLIEEIRIISARPGEGGLRIIDFSSSLTSHAGTVALKGDLQHAGMQVRMSNEVSEHENTTRYVLPEGTEKDKDDQVLGAWWVCGNFEIGGKHYALIHMTPPDHPTGVPVYSIRAYGRFGAFFEKDIDEGKPLDLTYRIVVSEGELDRAACQTLYDAYAKERQ